MVAMNPRKLFLHAAMLLSMAGVVFVLWAIGWFAPRVSCSICNGRGERDYISWDGDYGGVVRQQCFNCEGFRIRVSPEIQMEKVVPVLSAGFWALGFVSAVVGTLWALKIVECRDCGGSGFLALEVTSPGEGVSIVGDPCFFCEGRGRLTAVDRWVLRVFDRAEPGRSMQNLPASAAGKRRFKSRFSP
jgi:hypothetical protein